MNDIRAFLQAPALYPTALSYSTAVATIASISAGWVAPREGVVFLAIAAVFIVMLSMRREVKTVHVLVNSQYSRLERRIDQLTAALVYGGVAVPDDPSSPQANLAEGGRVT